MESTGSGSDVDENNDDDSSNGMPNSDEGPTTTTTDALTTDGDSDNDDDNNKGGDDEFASNDAPQTTNGNFANKRVCPTDQLSYLFSAYGDLEDFSAMSATWDSDNEMKSDRSMIQSLLHWVADGAQDTEDFTTFGRQSTEGSSADPCPSEGDESVSETRERLADGSVKTTNIKKDST